MNFGQMVVLMFNTRRRIKGHYLVSIGTLDTLLVHPREIFRNAIMVGISAIVLLHKHPSGDPTSSEADIRVTRELIRAGQLLKLEVLVLSSRVAVATRRAGPGAETGRRSRICHYLSFSGHWAHWESIGPDWRLEARKWTLTRNDGLF